MSAPGIDLLWLDRALALAERGRYTVSPNPMVGAVVVRGGRPAGEGFHRRAGQAHAEVEALRQAGSRARGGDLYVTLEPCVHFGRTPPCTEAILAAGVRRVVVADEDPNPLVAGRGLRALIRGGLEVIRADGPRREAARRQNEKFRVWITRGRPFVLAKWAATLDGKTATRDGESRWITGMQARRRALLFREEYDAVLVGAGTVLADDPRLNRRIGLNRATPHWRIVLDGRLRVPESAALFRDPAGVAIATARPLEHPKVRRLASRGVTVWSVRAGPEGRIPGQALLARLAREGITSLMVEGGATTLWEFFRARCVDRLAVFLAPRILGGEAAPGGVGGAGFALRATAGVTELGCERIGRDLLLTGRVVPAERLRRR